MPILVVKKSITRDELRGIASAQFGDMVKAVLDVEQGIMAVGPELHADAETLLMEEESSRRENIWGINLYLEKDGEEFIEFDSMINLKPALGNRSRDVGDVAVREKIREIIGKLVVG